MAETDVKEFPKKIENESESFVTCKGENSSVVSATCDDQSGTSLTNTDRDYEQYSIEEEACSICIKKGKHGAATHFCKNCKPRGKYLCGNCLKDHTYFSNHHKVVSLSVSRKSRRKSDRQIKNTKEWAFPNYRKSSESRNDSLYSTIQESDQTTILSDSSRTLVENSVTSRTMTSNTTATTDCTETIGSDDQSLNIPNLQLFDRDSEGFDSWHDHRKDLVSSENRIIHSDISTDLLNLAPIALPDETYLQQNILRKRWYSLQSRSMQNLNSEHYEDIQGEHWTSGNEHGYSGARTDDSDEYESIANVPQNMKIRQNVALRKQSGRPARSMQNIYSRQNEDNPNENREYDSIHYERGWKDDRNYRASGGVNYEEIGWRANRKYLRRSERKRSDVGYTDLRYDQEENAYSQRYQDYSSINHSDGGSSYYRFKIKNKKKCIVM